MHWMEHLRVRTGRSAENDFRKSTAKFEAEAKKFDALVSWSVLRHATIEGDFSIILHWNSPQVEVNGSYLARTLAEHISILGMVDHSVWILYTDLKDRTAP